LGERYQIEFRAMYNIEKLGKWKASVPRNIPLKHVQWSEENYYKYMSEADIGIVPNLIPIRNLNRVKEKATVSKRYFVDTPEDYLIRFKITSNPGRIILFSRLSNLTRKNRMSWFILCSI